VQEVKVVWVCVVLQILLRYKWCKCVLCCRYY
jgi:hypothetical protein